MSIKIHPIIQFALDKKTDPKAVTSEVEKLGKRNSVIDEFPRQLHYSFQNRYKNPNDPSLLGRITVGSDKDEQLDAELRYFENDEMQTYTLVADSKNSNFDIGTSKRNPEALTGIFENMLCELAKIIKPAFSVNFFSEDEKQHYKSKQKIVEGLHRTTISTISTKPEDKKHIPIGLGEKLDDNTTLFPLTFNPFASSTEQKSSFYDDLKDYFQIVTDRFLGNKKEV